MSQVSSQLPLGDGPQRILVVVFTTLDKMFVGEYGYHDSLGAYEIEVIAAAASEPEANERGSSLISRRLHYRGLQSRFLTKRKELCLCASGRFRMRSI